MLPRVACARSPDPRSCVLTADCVAGCGVFGRDEMGGDFTFTQQQVDTLYELRQAQIASERESNHRSLPLVLSSCSAFCIVWSDHDVRPGVAG